jgi:hypothetical protein
MTEKQRIADEKKRGKAYELGRMEHETREGCINRHEAIIQLSHNKTGDDDVDVVIQKDIETIKALPPVTPGPTSCDVAISKQAAINAVNIGNLNPGIVEALQSILAELPPVIPQPKIGKWIINGSEYSETYSYKLNCSCSVCGYKAVFYDHISSTEPCLENANYVHKFCPNCGFRMIESQESVGNTDRFRKRG